MDIKQSTINESIHDFETIGAPLMKKVLSKTPDAVPEWIDSLSETLSSIEPEGMESLEEQKEIEAKPAKRAVPAIAFAPLVTVEAESSPAEKMAQNLVILQIEGEEAYMLRDDYDKENWAEEIWEVKQSENFRALIVDADHNIIYTFPAFPPLGKANEKKKEFEGKLKSILSAQRLMLTLKRCYARIGQIIHSDYSQDEKKSRLRSHLTQLYTNSLSATRSLRFLTFINPEAVYKNITPDFQLQEVRYNYEDYHEVAINDHNIINLFYQGHWEWSEEL